MFFARGDRKVGKVLEEAYRLGCIYDAWDEYLVLMTNRLQAFENTGVDIDFSDLRKREVDEIFPWDFINCGVTKIFPYKRMEECNGRECNPELPCKMFRLWGSKLRRRCLL